MIYILLPVHNRREITLRFVDQLKEQTHKDFRLVLIDDGSTDHTADAVVAALPNTVILSGNGSLWWAGALHEGFKWVKANISVSGSTDHVLIINDDVEVLPEFLENGLQILSKNSKTLLGARAFSWDTGEALDVGVRYDWEKNDVALARSVSEINCLSTRGLLMRAEDFLMIGGFRPLVLPHFLSDYEWTMRAARKGYRLLTSPEFFLLIDPGESGFDGSAGSRSLGEYCRRTFSLKNYKNPWIMTAFLFLSSPRKWSLGLYWAIWKPVLTGTLEFVPGVFRTAVWLIFVPMFSFAREVKRGFKLLFDSKAARK